MFRADVLLFFVCMVPCLVTSDPLSLAENESNELSTDFFSINELTTRADRYPVRAGEKSCITCKIASDLLVPECPEEGVYAHAVGCKDYYLCNEQKRSPVKLTCPRGQLFDRFVARCDAENDVVCEDGPGFGGLQNEVISYRSATPRINLRPTRPRFNNGLAGRTDLDTFGDLIFRNEPVDCSVGGIIPHPTDCNKFITCANNIPYNMNCPEGLHFDISIGVCNYPYAARCRSITTLPTTTDPATTTAVIATSVPTIPTILPTTQPDSSLKRVCYYTNWARYRNGIGKFLPEDVDPNFCTHINYAFAVLDSQSFLIKAHDSWADINLGGYKKITDLQNSGGRKVLLALGGWTDSAGSKYSELVADQTLRSKFISNAIVFLQTHNFNGLDLDWEFPKCWQSQCTGPAEDKQNFVEFVKELRIAFNKQTPVLLLTAAVSANPNIANQAYNIPELSKYLDFFNVMSYDYHGSWDKRTGHVAPLLNNDKHSNPNFNVDYSVQYYLREGAPRSKIVLGFPTYGRSFTLNNPSNFGFGAPASVGKAGPIVREAGMLSYVEICQNIKENGWTKVNGDEAVGPVAYKDDQWVGYWDVQTVAYYARYILENNLGGSMVWALDFDDFNAQCCNIASPLLTTVQKMFTGIGPELDDIFSQCSLPGISPQNLPQITALQTTKRTTQAPFFPFQPVISTEDDVQCLEGSELLPNPNNCQQYYACSNGTPIRMDCPTNLHFNPALEICDWPQNAGCQK